MSTRRIAFYLFFALLVVLVIGIPGRSQFVQTQQGNANLIPGRNVNMVAGTDFLTGDPYLQRQNEPSIAVSTRNPLHLLAGANDYRTVDMEIPAEELPGLQRGIAAADAWLGVFKSFDGGESWISKLLPGSLVDLSPESMSSPLHGYSAASDPVIRAGTNGLFFYSGMTFNRGQKGQGAVFVSRFIDNNNKESGDPIQYLDTKVLDKGNQWVFLDKPWIIVDIPRDNRTTVLPNGQVIPCFMVYVVYTSFRGNIEEHVRGPLMVTISNDSGNTWTTPARINDVFHPYQAASLAIDPDSGRLYVAWRRFAKNGIIINDGDAIMLSWTTNTCWGRFLGRSLAFSIPRVAAEITPFDQPTDVTMFRSNTYPTITVDNQGIVYLAWSQRNALGYARVVIKTFNSKTGTWQGPFTVCNENNEYVWGHQLMPSLSYAAGKVTLAWYDQRYDICNVPSYYIDDKPTNSLRHTIDVRATQFNPGPIPVFPRSVQVSKYPWLLYEKNSELWGKQLVHFKPNLDLFLHGTTAFIGDYIDLSPSPAFVPSGNGWKYNSDPVNNPVFHAAWGDNRDVIEPGSGDWTDYVAPENCVDGQGGKTGIRNQNIYTSRLSRGIIAGSPGNTKPLNIKRAFVVLIKNTTENERDLHLTIVSSGPIAQFQERGVESDSLDITVPPYSTMSTTVSVGPFSDKYASVTVKILENGTLLAKVTLNPDSTNPEIEDPDVDYPVPHVGAQTETHTPHVGAYQVIEWDYESASPYVAASDVGDYPGANDDWVTPHVAAPHVGAPHVGAPHVGATNIINPHVGATNFSADDMTEDSSLTDVYYGVDNIGNTTSSYSIGTLPVELPEGILVQLLVYRVYTTPFANGCQLVQQEHHELLSNITPHVGAFSPGGTSGNLQANSLLQDIPVDATAVIPPGGRVIIMYRILDKNKYDDNKIDPTAFVPEIKQDAKNIIDGQEQEEIPPPALVITTQSLNKGYVGSPYSQTLAAEGGYPPFTWSLVADKYPSWMSIDPSTGVISGTPTAPEGIYDVTVQVQDTPPADIQQQVTDKTFKLTVAVSQTLYFTISGVVNYGDGDLAGVAMNGFPGDVLIITDDNGAYSGTVDSGWTGTITPEKTGFSFDPPSITYDPVTSDLSEQNYTATLVPGISAVYVLEDSDSNYTDPPFTDTLTIIDPVNHTKIQTLSKFNISETIGGYKIIAPSDNGTAVIMNELVPHKLLKYNEGGNEVFAKSLDLNSIDVSTDSNIYALTNGHIYGAKVLLLDSDGNQLSEAPYGGVDIVVDDDFNSVWIVGDTVKRLNKNLELQFSVTPNPITWTAVSVDFTDTGDAWVAERAYDHGTGANRLLKISMDDGSVLQTIDLGSDFTPTCLSVDRSHNNVFWVASPNGGLHKFTDNGEEIDGIPGPESWSLKVNQDDGSVWVAGNGYVRHIASDGTLLSTIPLDQSRPSIQTWITFTKYLD